MTAPAAVAQNRDERDPWNRLAGIADPGSVVPMAGGWGGTVAATVDLAGVPTVVFATDPRVQGGALGAECCENVLTAYRQAVLRGRPVVGLWQSGGARLGDGVLALDGIGRVFQAMTSASGLVPQISLVLGPAAGGAAYGPALTDLVVLAPDARVFVTGPDVVRRVTGEDVDAVGLGGPDVHARHSGVAHVVAESERAATQTVRDLVSLLTRQGRVSVPSRQEDPSLCVPQNRRRAYDVKPVLAAIADEGTTLELQPHWARNVVTALGRLAGRSVGFVANQPIRLGGCLDSASAEKAARFVRLCDSQGIPVVTLVDVPGYLPGRKQETDGVVRRGAKLLHAYAGARVPKLTLVTRKAYGGAYIAMASRSLGAGAVFAWPGAEIGVMGPEAAVEILHRRQLEAAPDRPSLTANLAARFRAESVGISAAVAAGMVDRVVDPPDTRDALATALAVLDVGGRGHQGNIPL